MKYILETIAFTIDSCRIAQSAGAGRIELCDNPGEGGTTPSLGFITAARKLLHIPLYVMIRPRGGDFLYTDEEFGIMKNDIRLCKQLNCDGVVLGLLNADGSIHKKRTAQLTELAYPMGVTFHRAFDRCIHPLQALEDVAECGCERILTSGHHPSAIEGVSLINDLVKLADERIIIMPGSGVRSDNIIELAQKTGATEFHTSAKALQKSGMDHVNNTMKENLSSATVDAEEVRKLISLLNTINNK